MKTTMVALAAALSLTGCYTSPVPLTNIEQAEFDAALLGTWYEAESFSGNAPDELVIRRAGEREYDVQFTFTIPFSSTRSSERARGYVIWIGGIPFLNLRRVENGVSEWVFFRYELIGRDELQFQTLEENIPAAQNASDLLAFVRDNLHRAEIYTDVVRFRKKG